MKDNKEIFRTLALISQIGISMITPILICVFTAVFLEEKTGVQIFVPFVVLGMAAGFRNCYLQVKRYISRK